ncbi:histidine kinase-like protein [Actinocorallia herbida]|uniref:Histidine kinase-like protein n=1 Tax=Actinocorallia herbida TaxID=58109 RepID=A0A3N1DAG1_9ACTN|nr:ATP-binding protein [Actinocorallia herbida]ROO90507.1 histidine kinase-like protein [Actinocorallia herbida]
MLCVDSPEKWIRATGPLSWRRTFVGARDQVPRARAFVESLFLGTRREDDAGLIVTELVNNVVLHTRSREPGGWFGVEVVIDELAWLTVTDQGGADRPQIRPQAPVAEVDLDDLGQTGRGLFIVSELATSLDIQGCPVRGHTVRAVLDLQARRCE